MSELQKAKEVGCTKSTYQLLIGCASAKVEVNMYKFKILVFFVN